MEDEVEGRDEVLFTDPETAEEAVDMAADNAIAYLQGQIDRVNASRPKLKEAVHDLAARSRERFVDATFGTVYNGDPDEWWQFDIITSARHGDVLDFIWPIMKEEYKDLGLYPDALEPLPNNGSG